jgi:hypothetical protein
MFYLPERFVRPFDTFRELRSHPQPDFWTEL